MLTALQSHCSDRGRLLPLPKHAYMAALSWLCCKKTNGRVILFTDRWAKPHLDWLPWDEVHCNLDDGMPLPSCPTTGKILALSKLDRPFLHVDMDGMQWRCLPAHLQASHAFSLSFVMTEATHPHCLAHLLPREAMPDHILQGLAVRPHKHAAFGLLGGNAWLAWREAAQESLDYIAVHKDKLNAIGGYVGLALEEDWLRLAVEHRIGQPIDHLTPALYNWESPTVGHCHLCGVDKHNATHLARVKGKLQRLDPALFRLAQKHAGGH